MTRLADSRHVTIAAGNRTIRGDLQVPPQSHSLIIFAHGSGSSRHSARMQFVADYLNKGGLSTLLLDLLTPEEEVVDLYTSNLRFNIDLLSRRLRAATVWAMQDLATRSLQIGYFGASTGAASALVAAAGHQETIRAIVSRGGRPDLAGSALPLVFTPTLLIVGANDPVAISLNQQAAAQMRCDHRLKIVPGAGHLFEEPGTLEEVARVARGWFDVHLGEKYKAA